MQHPGTDTTVLRRRRYESANHSHRKGSALSIEFGHDQIIIIKTRDKELPIRDPCLHPPPPPPNRYPKRDNWHDIAAFQSIILMVRLKGIEADRLSTRRFGGKKFKIEIDSSFWRGEIQNRNRLVVLAGRNSKY